MSKRLLFLLLLSLIWCSVQIHAAEGKSSLSVLQNSVERTFPAYRSIRLLGEVSESVPQDAIDKLTSYHKEQNHTFQVFPAKRERVISYDRVDRKYHYDERLYGVDDEKRENPLMAEEIFWNDKDMLSLNHACKAAVVSTSPKDPLPSDFWVPENIFVINGMSYEQFIAKNEENLTPAPEPSGDSDAQMFRFKLPYTLKDLLALHPDAQIPDALREGLNQGRNPVVANEEVDFFVKKSEPRFVCGIRQRGPDGKVYQEITIDEVFILDNGILFPKKMTMIRNKLERHWNVEKVEIDIDIPENIFHGQVPNDYLLTDKNIDVTYEMAEVVDAATADSINLNSMPKVEAPVASNTEQPRAISTPAMHISNNSTTTQNTPSARAQTGILSIMVYLPPFVILIGLLIFLAPPNAVYGFRNRYTKQDPYVWRVSSRSVGSAIVLLSFLVYLLFPSRKPENIFIADIVCVGILLVSMAAGYIFSRWLLLRRKDLSTPTRG